MFSDTDINTPIETTIINTKFANNSVKGTAKLAQATLTKRTSNTTTNNIITTSTHKTDHTKGPDRILDTVIVVVTIMQMPTIMQVVTIMKIPTIIVLAKLWPRGHVVVVLLIQLAKRFRPRSLWCRRLFITWYRNISGQQLHRWPPTQERAAITTMLSFT